MKIIINKRWLLLTRWDYATWSLRLYVHSRTLRLHAGHYTLVVSL